MALVLQIAICISLYLVTTAIYNLKFHPLAKYPGPKLWILSRLPYLICMNAGCLPFRIKELHDEYGPVVRVSNNELSFSDGRAWKDIFTRKEMLRPPQWGARAPGVEAHNVISAPVADHARYRKAMAPAFSEKSVKDGNSAVIDLVDWVNYATFDIIGDISWGKSYDCHTTGSGHAFMGILLHFQAIIIGASIGYFPWLNMLLANITPKSAFRMLETIFEDGHERLLSRLETKQMDHPDIVSHIANYNSRSLPSERLSNAEIEQNVLTMIIGGSETLTAFSGAFHYLLANPTKLAKVTHEVRTSFKSESDVNGSSLAKLRYLNAVIDETLRLCPPLPDMLRRDVPAGSIVMIAGHNIPPRTTVSVSCYSMFNSGQHFNLPEAFLPERFLTKESKIDDRDGPTLSRDNFSVFYPFSLGAHNCPGQALARLELRLLLALLLYKFNFSVPHGARLRKWTEQKVYWTWEKQPLKIEIRRPRRS